MRGTLVALTVAVLLAGAHAAPVPFPVVGDTAVYSQDFDAPLGVEWTLDGWQVGTIPASGYTTVIGNGVNTQLVAPSNPSGLSFPATFPLPAVSVDSYSNYGFASGWLVTNGEGVTTRTALVEFNNLPSHNGLDLDLLLGAGNSIDGGEGLLVIRVDGITVFSRDFESGGRPNFGLAGTGIVRMVDQENIDLGHYRERWNDNGGAGPFDENDRIQEGWTVASAYDLAGALDLTGVAHIGGTLTVEIIHDLNSGPFDEYFAIENFAITLNNVVPEPATMSLLAVGGLALLRRRRRKR